MAQKSPAQQAAQYGYTSAGVYIVEVTEQSTADAGLASGDRIISIDDTIVNELDDVTEYLSGKQPGDVVKVWAANGVLHIHTPQPATVRVVSFSGALFRLMDVPGGDVQFTLPDNLYIVTVGDEVKKIKVR